MSSFLVTGGTGFIGAELVYTLIKSGHNVIVLTRDIAKANQAILGGVSFIDSLSSLPDRTDIDVIINLAGEGIADKRWTNRRKKILYKSRIGVTNDLVTLVARLQEKPKVMISGSAIGYYGAQDDSPLDENAEANIEYTHELCKQWEEAAEIIKQYGVRLCIARLGLVLEKHGGILNKMFPAVKLCLAGRIGDGDQIMSWIHLYDAVKAIIFLVENESCEGVYNLTTIKSVSNREFIETLGRAVNRPTFCVMPEFVIKLLFGEMGERLLLKGQNVEPRKLIHAGYEFSFTDLEKTLENI